MSPTAHDLVRSGAEQVAQERHDREERRRMDLAEQRSDVNPPDVRIRMWERIHGLRLPSDPEHPIVDVIAVSTRLTIEEVREEQELRRAQIGRR